MIILYEQHKKYPSCLVVPDDLPFKLSVESRFENGQSALYSLTLTAGAVKETILFSEDIYGLTDACEEAVDLAIAGLFSQIIRGVTDALTLTLRDPDKVLDLTSTIDDEIALWLRFFEQHTNTNKGEIICRKCM